MRELRLLIACSFILIYSTNAAAQDYSGTWTGVVTESTSDCKNIVKAKPGEYQLTFVQKGDELTIVEPARGNRSGNGPTAGINAAAGFYSR